MGDVMMPKGQNDLEQFVEECQKSKVSIPEIFEDNQKETLKEVAQMINYSSDDQPCEKQSLNAVNNLVVIDELDSENERSHVCQINKPDDDEFPKKVLSKSISMKLKQSKTLTKEKLLASGKQKIPESRINKRTTYANRVKLQK